MCDITKYYMLVFEALDPMAGREPGVTLALGLGEILEYECVM